MKRNSQYIWVILLLLAVFIVDSYYQITGATVPIWQTQWFIERVIGFGLIIIILLSYYFYRLSKNRHKNLEEYKFKMMHSQEAEWKRIAGELHDNIGQNLSAMNIYLQQNIKLLPERGTERQNLQSVSDMLVETLEDVRRISTKLYPQQIERLGLTIAIKSMTEKLTASTGIRFDLHSDNIDLLFPKETEVYFYRIIQEALNNIIKHSKAESADIVISKTMLFVQVTIKDNGVGFDMNKFVSSDVSKLGFGLLNLDDRINLVRGTYQIQSEPDKGTSLKITVPIKRMKESANKIKVIIADDHPIFLKGILSILKDEPAIEVLGEASNGEEALELIKKLKPDVVLLDVDMPKLNGLETARILQKEMPGLKTAILTMHKDKEYFNEAMDINVKAFVLKDKISDDLVECIKTIYEGEYYISPAISGYLVEKKKFSPIPELEKLTAAEKEVLKLLSQNRTSKQIADELFNSIRTIENHRNNICKKLGLSGNNKLLLFAIEKKAYL